MYFVSVRAYRNYIEVKNRNNECIRVCFSKLADWLSLFFFKDLPKYDFFLRFS